MEAAQNRTNGGANFIRSVAVHELHINTGTMLQLFDIAEINQGDITRRSEDHKMLCANTCTRST